MDCNKSLRGISLPGNSLSVSSRICSHEYMPLPGSCRKKEGEIDQWLEIKGLVAISSRVSFLRERIIT